MEHDRKTLSLGAAGMRGEVGAGGLEIDNVLDFASAFGTMNAGAGVLLATDPRQSGDMLRRVVASALAACGCRVIDGGVLTAGMAQYLIPALDLAGGILITGGHQPAGSNALLPLAADGAYFDDLRRRELFDFYHGRRFAAARFDAVPPVEPLPGIELENYWNDLESRFDMKAIRSAGLTAVIDFCNGAGARFRAEFARRFGVRLIGLNDTPCGVIPRDPEPRPRTAAVTASVVGPLHAAFGLVFNSDLSRMGVVTDDGEPLSEEVTYPLALDYLLERAPRGAKIVSTVCTSRLVELVAARHGAEVVRSKVGQSFVAAAMKESRAFAGGEGNGSFWFGTRRGSDGFLMAGLLLELVATRGALSARRALLPKFHLVKQIVPCRRAHGYNRLRELRNFFPEAQRSELDGLRFDWPDGFLSVRLSTTESVIRLIADADAPEAARERVRRARLFLEKALN